MLFFFWQSNTLFGVHQYSKLYMWQTCTRGMHREVVSTSCRVMSYDVVLVLVLVLLLMLVLVVVWVLVLMLALVCWVTPEFLLVVVSWRLLDACSYCLQASGYLLLFPRRP